MDRKRFAHDAIRVVDGRGLAIHAACPLRIHCHEEELYVRL
jgi:hypothetical protein